MKYKGYHAAVQFDEVDEILVGRISGINDVIGFHADNAHDLKAAFVEAVDDYLETCVAAGKRPEKSFSGQVLIRTNPETHSMASIAADVRGISLNELGDMALREKAEEILNG